MYRNIDLRDGRNKRNENRKTSHILDLREREKPEQGRLA